MMLKRHASAPFYLLSIFALCLCCQTALAAPAVPAAPSVSNRPAQSTEVGYLPADGQRVEVNPPPLAWLKEDSASSYRIEIASSANFSRPEVKVDGWKYLLYTHTETLAPGKHYWRYGFETSTGLVSNWSAVRSFEIPADATPLPRPTRAYLEGVIPHQHPRMFVRPEQLAALRLSQKKLSSEWTISRQEADRVLTAPLMAEPRPWSGGQWNSQEWMTYYGQITTASATIETLAFAYLVSKEPAYGQAARKWLLNFASWDPLGTTCMNVNDEQGMAILYSASRTYSWIHDLLSDSDRQTVLKAMRARGNDAFAHLARREHPYEQDAYDSHSGRMWLFLGEAAVAFYDEIPEAKEWLDYALTIFYGWYPIWGDSDGGWAEGLHYWQSYNEYATWWFDLMRSILNLDPTRKPFYAHVGDFPLYVAPPGSAMSGFGDFSESAPEIGRGRVVGAYAAARQNPQWQWYAEKMGPGSYKGPLRYLRAFQPKPAPAAPPRQDSPLKVFEKAGWAVFNTSLSDAHQNVQFMLRASPYGNISHSHDDQNNIVLGAYGWPLLVNSGRRDYYGSPFCRGWYWATRGHNCLLVDGQGQLRGPDTKARLVAHGGQGEFAYAVGDASAAYGSGVKLYRRWTAFVGGEAIALLDEVVTTGSKVELLFHARAPFELSPNRQGFHLTNGQASLEGWFFASRPFELTQSDHYPIQPENGLKTPPEWHLSAAQPTDSSSSSPLLLLTVLAPHKKQSPAQVVTPKATLSPERVRLLWKDSSGQEQELSFEPSPPPLIKLAIKAAHDN